MTPEEVINKQTWEILQAIKEESLAPEEDGTFFYETTRTVLVVGEHSPSQERKIAIVRKLAREEKAIEIIKEIPPDWRGDRNGFYLRVLQPQFDLVYEKYKKACDLTSYLNDYQQRMFKGDDNLPEFFHLENTNDKERTTPASPTKKHKGQMFETGGGGGGARLWAQNYPSPLGKKPSIKEIVDGFSPPNYPFVLTVVEKIASLEEFSSDGTIHYQLQSPPGQLLVQERMLLTKLEAVGLFKNAGEDGIFGIATLRNVDIKTIKQIIIEINERQSNLQAKPEEKSGNPKAKYNQLLDEIRKSSQPPTELRKRHGKILQDIKSKSSSGNKPQDDKAKINNSSFSLTDNVLVINGKQIEFRKDTRKLALLKLLVKKQRGIYYSEVVEELEGATTSEIKNAKNICYEACRGLENSLAKAGITDFLKFDFNQAQINPLYKRAS